jgi:hypothetical protein
MFPRNMLSRSSGSKIKPSKKAAETGGVVSNVDHPCNVFSESKKKKKKTVNYSELRKT